MGLGYNVSYNGFAVCKVLKTGGRKIGNSRNFGGQPEGILGRFASPCGLREGLRQSGRNLICFLKGKSKSNDGWWREYQIWLAEERDFGAVRFALRAARKPSAGWRKSDLFF